MKISIFQRNKAKSDQQLLSLFKKDKDIAVLGELYNRYIDMVMGLSLKYLQNVHDSEDAVMEIFEVIVRRLPNHDVENFKSWLYKVSSNHCLDILRKKKRTSEKDKDIQLMQSSQKERLDNSWMSEEMDEKELLLNSMEDCIEQLDLKQQECVKMFYLEKKSYEVVSQTLEISWSQTRSFIQNGRRNLKKCMEKKHEAAR